MPLTDELDEVRAPQDGAKSHVHRRRRLGFVVGGIAIVVLVGSAVPYLLYLRRSHPGAAPVSSAVQRYRASTSTTNDQAAELIGPQPGVYQAHGLGTERISFPPNSQTDGAVMPITVTPRPNGCWRWRIDYNTAHWHEYDFCARGDSLLLVAQRNFQRWDFGAIKVSNLGAYACSPPAPVMSNGAGPHASFEHRCTGTNSAVPGLSRVDGPVTMAGLTTLDIGGETVQALRQTRVEHLSGAQKGTVTEQWWFDARNGLPLRAERTYRVSSPSPVGNVVYTEHGWWQLTSLHPTT